MDLTAGIEWVADGGESASEDSRLKAPHPTSF
jgi:hypothetical protein